MKRIIKANAPAFWVSYKRRHPTHKYANLDETVEGQTVRNQLRQNLQREQRNICCYCCCVLSPGDMHNEHIKPQKRYNQLTMDYENIVVSCSSTFTCGMKKDHDYDECKFVSPLDENCADHFIFYPDGSIDYKTSQGEYAIKLLGLNNSRSLRERRKSQYDTVYALCRSYVLNACDCISLENEDEFTAAEELYQEFFAKEVAPDFFIGTSTQLPAFSDMLEFFREQGNFDFDYIVDDLKCSGEL